MRNWSDGWLDGGALEMFVDILTRRVAAVRPPIDITPPPPQLWELRLIVWRARHVPTTADYSGLLDLSCACRFGDGSTSETDVHLRASGGAGSFNWRFKYPVTLSQTSHLFHRDHVRCAARMHQFSNTLRHTVGQPRKCMAFPGDCRHVTPLGESYVR